MPKYPLEVIRHSLAHVLAQAVQELYPKQHVELGIGPVIQNGLYYDLKLAERLSDDDLPKVEEKMREIIDRDLSIERFEISREDAIELFEQKNQNLKVELIREMPEGEVITYYTHQDQFIDLCRGPHVEKTSQISKHFRLTNIAGAYWRGQEDKPMLQRIYAVAFDDGKKLREHLRMLEEAKKRDHRKLGKELDLFHFDPVAPASPFFTPKGTVIYNELTEFIRSLYRKYDYREVITPQILESSLWHTSGHYENYKDNMYFTNIDDREFAVKPMNCPCHMLMFKQQKYSYRDLPLRMADFGRLHRYEKSGVTAGLTRVRTFCQDDAHIFIKHSDVETEITSLMGMIVGCYEHFGFKDMTIALSTRPPKRIGSDEMWDQSERALRQALDASPFSYTEKSGDGAFYGPKIDIDVADAIGRSHQLGTIQLDFQLPERFGLSFTNEKGEPEQPVVIHRAILGSLERFFGLYLEHTAGIFPFSIAPEQIVIIPVHPEHHLQKCLEWEAWFKDLGVRVRVDARNESLGLKTRQTQKAKIPFMAVIGDQEVSSSQIALRAYGEKSTQVFDEVQCRDKIQELLKMRLPQDMNMKDKSL